MKKFKLLSIFMFVVSLFVVCGSVNAATKSLEIISDEEYPEIEIYKSNDTTNKIRQVNILKDTNGSRVYCMDMGSNPPNNGTRMTTDDADVLENSHIYAYIINTVDTLSESELDNGSVVYKSRNFTTNLFETKEIALVSKRYLLKQFAIWYYDNNGEIIQDVSHVDITQSILSMYPKVETIVNDAKSNKNVLNKELIVTINGNTNMKLSEDGKTYESEKLTVTSSRGGKVTLSIINNGIEGIQIYNEDGQKVEEISSGSKVIIKVPVSSIKLGQSSFKLKVTATSKNYKMYKYSSTDTSIQSVGKLESESVSKSAEKDFSIEKKSTTKFSKISVVNQEELPGAKLRILDENKEPLMYPDGKPYEWVSTGEPHYIYGLPAGKYYLQELIAPEGYVMSDEIVEFEVKEDGSITEVVMENDLEVEVPDTLSSRSILLLVIGMLDIALGIGILLYVKKNKATE